MAKDIDELKERASHYSLNLFSTPALKVIGMQTAILAQAASAMKAEMLLLFVLTTVDLITAMIAAARLNRVCSWGMRQSVLKLSIYIVLVYLGHLTRIAVGIDWIGGAFIGLIVSTEFISILENIELIRPGILPKKMLSHFGITLKKAKRK